MFYLKILTSTHFKLKLIFITPVAYTRYLFPVFILLSANYAALSDSVSSLDRTDSLRP